MYIRKILPHTYTREPMRKVWIAILSMLVTVQLSAQPGVRQQYVTVPFCEPFEDPMPGLAMGDPDSLGFDPSVLTKVDGLIDSTIVAGTIPGAVLCVVKNDRIAYLKAYGNRMVTPFMIPMTTDAVFDLASLSKPVSTATCVMQLIENGRIKLSDKVSDYIDDFQPWVDKKRKSRKQDITIQDLLTHSSGLAAYTSATTQEERFGRYQPDSLMWCIAHESDRGFQPRTKHRYSCLNFITLQHILQKVTGMRLCDYAEENLFKPLGMRSTTYFPLEEFRRWDLRPYAVPTEVQPDDSLALYCAVHDPLARICNAGNSGNAGVFSTAEDLALLAAAMMNGGEIMGRRILKPETVRLMMTIPRENAARVGTALGWDVFSSYSSCKGTLLNDSKTVCHTGYTGTSMVMDLEDRIAIILLTNRVHPFDKGSLKLLRIGVADTVAASAGITVPKDKNRK